MIGSIVLGSVARAWADPTVRLKRLGLVIASFAARPCPPLNASDLRCQFMADGSCYLLDRIPANRRIGVGGYFRSLAAPHAQFFL